VYEFSTSGNKIDNSLSLLKNVKKKSSKSFAINFFFRIIVKGIADFAQMVGYLVNQVYIIINQAMNRTFTKHLCSDFSLQPQDHFQKHFSPEAGTDLRTTDLLVH